jgi:hypothetical protein
VKKEAMEAADCYHKTFSPDIKAEVEEIEDKIRENRGNTSTEELTKNFTEFLIQDSPEAETQNSSEWLSDTA